MAAHDNIQLVYDKQCPICEFYCQKIDVDDSFGSLLRIDARIASDAMNEITNLGLDIDEGMVLKVGDDLFYGADAINRLARMSSRSGIINRLAYWIFRSRGAARALYPMFRAGRNLLLKLLRRSRINNLGLPGNDHF